MEGGGRGEGTGRGGHLVDTAGGQVLAGAVVKRVEVHQRRREQDALARGRGALRGVLHPDDQAGAQVR